MYKQRRAWTRTAVLLRTMASRGACGRSHRAALSLCAHAGLFYSASRAAHVRTHPHHTGMGQTCLSYLPLRCLSASLRTRHDVPARALASHNKEHDRRGQRPLGVGILMTLTARLRTVGRRCAARTHALRDVSSLRFAPAWVASALACLLARCLMRCAAALCHICQRAGRSSLPLLCHGCCVWHSLAPTLVRVTCTAPPCLHATGIGVAASCALRARVNGQQRAHLAAGRNTRAFASAAGRRTLRRCPCAPLRRRYCLNIWLPRCTRCCTHLRYAPRAGIPDSCHLLHLGISLLRRTTASSAYGDMRSDGSAACRRCDGTGTLRTRAALARHGGTHPHPTAYLPPTDTCLAALYACHHTTTTLPRMLLLPAALRAAARPCRRRAPTATCLPHAPLPARATYRTRALPFWLRLPTTRQVY